jgi:hypothetical protein
MDVLVLLESKNRCLQRFLSASSQFLANSGKGDFSGLDAFQRQRDMTIQALELYDRKIATLISNLSPTSRTPELIERVTQTLSAKEKLLKDILSIDTQILICIEAEKTRISREIAGTRKNTELVGKFKSTWVSEAGEELDTNL